MKDRNNQSLMSLLTPPADKDGLAAFLRAAARAVGGRSDGDLSRAMGVPASSIANWKRRGVLSEQAKSWFKSNFVTQVAASSTRFLPNSDAIAIDVVSQSIVLTNGNPLDAKTDVRFVTALSFGGMLAWAQFVCDVQLIKGLDCSFGNELLLETYRQGLPGFRAFTAIERFFD